MSNAIHYSELDRDGYLTGAYCGRAPNWMTLSNQKDAPPETYVTCKWCLRKLSQIQEATR